MQEQKCVSLNYYNHCLTTMTIEIKSKKPSYGCNHGMMNLFLVLVVFLCAILQIIQLLRMNNEENLQNMIRPEFQELWWSQESTPMTLLVAENQHHHVPTKEELGRHEWCHQYQKKITEFAPFVDKHAVKQFVANVTFANSSQDITTRLLYTKLPFRYTMKANHMSGGNVLVTNRHHTKCLNGHCKKRQPTQNIADYLRKMYKIFLDTNYGRRSGQLEHTDIYQKKCILILKQHKTIKSLCLMQDRCIGIYTDRFQAGNKTGLS